jgi:hypothetical protein
MNERGREALRAAALAGVPQSFGILYDGKARCGLGVLADEAARNQVLYTPERYGLHSEPFCGICGMEWRSESEAALVVHLNDTHRLDFLGIAEKMPVSEETR